uniref:interleukin-20 receptor subunit alpha-like n=1 Tax=Myxine glutinosa TaxID=7769 RepID=UPI00358E6472
MVESLDMRHMVHWNSVPGAANYTLQHQISYFRRNNPKIWANVRCPVAHTLQCNVTREMTFGKHYFRVRATRNGHVSNWTESSPFEPTKSTKLSAPRVRMEMKGAVLLVWLDGEAQWLRKELVTKTTYFLYYCTMCRWWRRAQVRQWPCWWCASRWWCGSPQCAFIESSVSPWFCLVFSASPCSCLINFQRHSIKTYITVWKRVRR